MTQFWKSWMRTWCWAVIGFGVVFALAAFPETSLGATLFYDLVYWPLDGASAFGPNVAFTTAVLGAVMIGWGLSLLALADAADRIGVAAWRAMTLSVAVWWGVDSAISIAAGVPMNAATNTVFLATFLVPILGSGALAGPSPRTV